MSRKLFVGILPYATGRTKTASRRAYGFIRVRNGRAIFFHRADLRDATTFNTQQVGGRGLSSGSLEDRSQARREHFRGARGHAHCGAA